MSYAIGREKSASEDLGSHSVILKRGRTCFMNHMGMPLSLNWVLGKRILAKRSWSIYSVTSLGKTSQASPIFWNQTPGKHNLIALMGWKHNTSSTRKPAVRAEDLLRITMQRKAEMRLIIHMQNYRQCSPASWRQCGRDRHSSMMGGEKELKRRRNT